MTSDLRQVWHYSRNTNWVSGRTVTRACCGAGKPLALHGSYGREYATGRGVMLATRELLRAEHLGKIAGKDFVVQARTRSACPAGQQNCFMVCWQRPVDGNGPGSAAPATMCLPF